VETSAEGINFKIIKLKLPEVWNLANDAGGGEGVVYFIYFLFFINIGTVYLQGRFSLWAKTKLAFAQAYFDYGSEIDWFLKVYPRFFKVTLQRHHAENSK
jgi:hypothetical protein